MNKYEFALDSLLNIGEKVNEGTNIVYRQVQNRVVKSLATM